MIQTTLGEASNYLTGGVVPAALRDLLEREGETAARVVRKWVRSALDHLYFVGCGGSYAIMQPAKYILDRYSQLPVDAYTGWEFVNRAPTRLTPRSAVVLASHSGTTPEVLAGLELAQARRAHTLSFSVADSELTRRAEEKLTYNSPAVNLSKLLMAYLVTAHMLIEGGDVEVGNRLLTDMQRLPELSEQVIANTEARGRQLAGEYAAASGFYVVGTGILAGLAYQFRTCTLLEMQWLHSAMINAGELAHGPLEIIDRDTPFIFLVGNDEGREIAVRAYNFTRRYSEKVLLFDLKEIADCNPLLAPFLVHIALQWFAWHLSISRNHPLSVRRYMGKVEY